MIFRNTQNSTLFIGTYRCSKNVRLQMKRLYQLQKTGSLWGFTGERDWMGHTQGLISTCNVSFIHIQILKPIGQNVDVY